MRRSGNPCLGCGCNFHGSLSKYCGKCERDICSVCGARGIKYYICFQCRWARGSKE